MKKLNYNLEKNNSGKRIKSKSKLKTIFKWSVLSIFFVIISLSVLVFGYVFSISKNLEFDENTLKQINTNLQIFDSENKPLYATNNQSKKVKLDELPAYVPASFISIEDKNFYSHSGLNYKRIAKAVINNLKSGTKKEGASTISQQLIKNTHLSSEKTIERKIKEMILTKKMEKKISKNEILETYLNAIYFGNGAYGLESASNTYFDKSAKDLTISESAMLAGLIKSPKKYSPIFEKTACEKRRNIVLNEMLKDGVISSEDFGNAISQKIVLNMKQKNNHNFYEQAVLEEASNILNLSEKNLASKNYYIFTYLDSDTQMSLIDAVNNENYYHENSFGNIADSAGIVLDNNNGGVVAFAGKSCYDIVNMVRSPGSSIKPILVYAPALENGVISPISPILDEPTSFDGYKPNNVGSKYYGYVSATESVEKSLNIPAIKIMKTTGIEKSKDMAKRCGIVFDKNDNGYSIALGGMTKGTTIKQLVNSYIPFSSSGQFVEAKFIRKICDNNGQILYENKSQKKQVMSEETAYLMNEMLVSGVKKGTSCRLNDTPFEVAGKTGTVGIKNTNLNSDVWSVAYTKNHTFGVWLGNSTGDKEYMLEGCNNGGTYCTSLLKEVIENTYQNKPKPQDFEVPSGIEIVELDSVELEKNHAELLADKSSPDIFKTKASFNKKYKPTRVAKTFSELDAVSLSINVDENKPTLVFTAIPHIEYKVYRINDDECKVIDTIKNKKGEIEIKDDNVENDTFYTYYVEAVANNYASNTKSKRIRSNSEKVYIS